jgi:hypothetical protein
MKNYKGFKMKKRKLGYSGLEASALGLPGMPMIWEDSGRDSWLRTDPIQVRCS